MSIVVTGSNGFIGGSLTRRLNQLGHQVIGVDNSGDLEIADFLKWIPDHHRDIEIIYHLGANTNTLEMDEGVFKKYNFGYSESLWYKCARYKIPFVYASSAATYGYGELGYSDELHPAELHPINPYGVSKNEFDKFILQHNHINDSPFWAGLKFFNVYGHNESRKGKMASMVYQAYSQIKETEKVSLFKYGEQKRDFVYVEDIVDVLIWLRSNRKNNGIYNVGTGQANSFYSMVGHIFDKLNLPEKIEFFDMPDNVKQQYQSFTEADIKRLRKIGYNSSFTSLEEGVKKYVQQLENEATKIPA